MLPIDARDRRGRTGRRGGAASVEAPLAISGLAAWWDSRTTVGATWASRAGSIAGASLTVGGDAVYAASVASLGNKPAMQFPGSTGYLETNTTNDYKFLHDGTGSSIWAILRVDSTGGATQRLLANSNSSLEIGTLVQFTTTQARYWVQNGSGTNLNDWTTTTAGHFTRDNSRWQCWSYTAGTLRSRVSGSDITNADTGGQLPSASNPTRALRFALTSGGGSPFKGYIAQIMLFAKALSAAELTALGAWANQIYGVTA